MTEAEQHSNVFDSGRQYLADVYARALLGATEKTGITEEVIGELHAIISELFAKLPQLDATLCSPRIPFDDKERILDRALKGRISNELLNFLKVLARRGRFDCLRMIETSIRKLWNELRKRIEVSVTSAVPLDHELQSHIAGRLKEALGSEVEMRTSVDPELVGGLLVRIGDSVYDGSLANQLLQLRKTAIDKATQQMRQSIDRFMAVD